MTAPRNVTLVFPPAADPSLPYGALPLLGAVLRRGGYTDVSLRDVNLEAFDALLDPDVLRPIAEKPHPSTSLRDSATEAIANIDEAKRIMRDPVDFYDPGKLMWAKRILHLAGNVLTRPYPRLRFGKYSYSTSGYDSYPEIERAVRTDGGPLAEYFQRVTAPSILARNPAVVGVSVPYFSQLIPAFLLAEAIREQRPDVHIAFGGPIVTWGKDVLAGDARFSRWLDTVLLGEADETFLHLVQALNGEGDIASVPNLIRYSGGRVDLQSRPGYQLNLDWLPAPDYTLMPMADYLAPKRIICMTPTRGCYYNKCAFCNYSFIKLAPYRMRSPRLIADDVASVVQSTGENVFCFEADVLLPSHLLAMAEAFIARDLDIKWHSVARFEKGFTQDLLDTMRRAGCIRLYMGLESANDRVLEAMRKGTNAQRMAEILAMCHAAGIAVEAGVFSEFPSETPAEAEDTYRFIRDHRHVISRADVGTFRLLKGAPIAETPELYGITLRDDPARRWYHLRYTDPALTDGPAVTAMERIQRLYPETALIDIPEDILYTERHGARAWRDYFDRQDAAPTNAPAIGTADSLTLSAGSGHYRVRITNSGAVHSEADELDGSLERPTFEASSHTLDFGLDRSRSRSYPLDAAEARILALLGRGECRVERVYAELASQHQTSEVAAAIAHLLRSGLIQGVKVGS